MAGFSARLNPGGQDCGNRTDPRRGIQISLDLGEARQNQAKIADDSKPLQSSKMRCNGCSGNSSGLTHCQPRCYAVVCGHIQLACHRQKRDTSDPLPAYHSIARLLEAPRQASRGEHCGRRLEDWLVISNSLKPRRDTDSLLLMIGSHEPNQSFTCQVGCESRGWDSRSSSSSKLRRATAGLFRSNCFSPPCAFSMYADRLDH